MFTSAQSRGARAMLGWSRGQLAEASKVALRTIVDFERDAREPRHSTLEVLQRALETAGVIFVAENGEGPGVRLRKGLKAASTAPAPDEGNRTEKRRKVRGHAENAVERALADLPHIEHEKASKKRKLTRVPKELKPT